MPNNIHWDVCLKIFSIGLAISCEFALYWLEEIEKEIPNFAPFFACNFFVHDLRIFVLTYNVC